MGAVGGSVLLLVLLVVRAEEEPFLGQREVTLDLLDLLDEDSQKPVPFSLHDFPELGLDLAEVKEVVPVVPDIMRAHQGPARFGPRSMGPPQIPFPLARPNTNNIQAICRYSDQRPRYPKETLPSSGFGYLVRQARAINQLESWYSVCCSSGTQDEGQLLCCAEQAWKKSLSVFCDEEFSIKTNHYYCCKKRASERRTCFEEATPEHLQSYVPSEHERGSWADIPSVGKGFKFNPSTCNKQRSLVAPRAIRENVPNADFPPGRPNSGNIESICANHKQRLWYVSRCLLRKANSERVAHQAKAINALEKGFNQCCKKRKEKESCAEMKWKMMVDEFCKDGQKADMSCCEKEKGEEQYKCFAAAATNPGYTPNSDSTSLNQARPSLDTFCEMYRKSMFVRRQVEDWRYVAGEMTKRCCSSVKGNNSACLQTQMDSILESVCSYRMISSCCEQRGQSRSMCFTKKVLHDLAEVVNRSSWKICRTPL